MIVIRRGNCRLSTAATILVLMAAACEDVPTAPTVGTIRVSVQTFGGDPDIDGYEVVLGSEKRRVDTGGNITFSDLQPGAYRVALEDVAGNCTVDDDISRTITVAGPDVVTVRFVVSCAMTGIEISARKTGIQDTHGYLVSVDGRDPVRMASNGSFVISRLEPGLHTLVVDPGKDCKLSGPGELTVEVTNRSVTIVTLDAACAPPTDVTIRFGNFFDCWDPVGDPTQFRDATGSSQVVVRVGTKVQWVYEPWMHPACTAHVVSTLVPAGGLPIDSGILKPGESFEFVPAVTGTWQFTDLISGGSGALIVIEAP